MRAIDRRAILVCAAFASIVCASRVSAESGNSYRVFGPKCGYDMRVDCNWVNGSGYRPLRIEIATLNGTPVAAATRFKVEIQTGNQYGQVTTVSHDLVIESGQPRGTATISIPQSDFGYGEVNVFESGVELPELTVFMQHDGSRSNGASVESPSVLVIDKDAPSLSQRAARRDSMSRQVQPPDLPNTGSLPNVRALMTEMPIPNVVYGNTFPNDTEIVGMFDANELMSLQRPGDLPERWIDLTCFDLAIISWDDLQLLASQHPKKFQALRQWTSSGATLCVFGIGDNFQRRSDLEELLFGRSLDAGPYGSWSVPQLKDNGPVRITATSGMAVEVASPETPPPDQLTLLPVQPAPLSNATPPFLLHPFSTGLVVAIGAADPFSDNTMQWKWLLNSIDANRWSWSRRHAMYGGQPTDVYWMNLVPGVGQPPVTAFRILITLFVLVIGPVNYHLLRRAGRLHLLLLTVPVGAAVVTFSLIGYAILSDGLGVRARIRSYTYLDQRNESATCWSRQSYYAGMTPSGGLVFPEDAAVYRVDPDQQSPNQNRWKLQWDANGQRLAQGYIQSRVTSQFLVVRARQSKAQLAIQESATPGEPPTIENLLRSKIQYLLLADSNGNYFAAENILAGETFQPAPFIPGRAIFRIMQAITENEPVIMVDDLNEYARSERTSRVYGVTPTVNITDTLDMLERNIHRIRDTGLSGMKPRTYLAIVDQSPEVPLGVKHARPVKSFHIIEGTW